MPRKNPDPFINEIPFMSDYELESAILLDWKSVRPQYAHREAPLRREKAKRLAIGQWSKTAAARAGADRRSVGRR